MIITRLLLNAAICALVGIITFGLTDSLLATLLAGFVTGAALPPMLKG